MPKRMECSLRSNHAQHDPASQTPAMEQYGFEQLGSHHLDIVIRPENPESCRGESLRCANIPDLSFNLPGEDHTPIPTTRPCLNLDKIITIEIEGDLIYDFSTVMKSIINLLPPNPLNDFGC